ncbi:sulfide-dependent adenosine diphosphate thiazole synthase [Methanonatronarchaeum sp. AMET6-2]|uniref:sulfide-dependent adenosine diphosphate thiazole synthase n=1 Tax=Methanonatronarchaeum sp. AMET6-2 TaxID=2933293 RepID=UPI001FF596CE|nr:sulfide-dependent adenosine diphosphate thiazole synthase [Methanonatronarchaeum sp. AMET6-2]UOY10367.1 sulfide-dependent adenosine diphosphate thiazole synthase [Methanonatronarchaeum sp. AMET6-2]
MNVDDKLVSKAIIKDFSRDFLNSLDVDVAIAGAGPAGLVAARYLAENDIETVVFERKLSVGGGMWGGGIMFPRIVVKEKSLPILDDFDINYRENEDGYYTANSIESVGKLASKAIDAGAEIYNLMTVEDLLYRDSKVSGVVINWSSVDLAGLHVDPITVESKIVIDTTGHDCDLARKAQEKTDQKLLTKTGGVIGEKAMSAEQGEKDVIDKTGMIMPGLYVAGMAVNAVHGKPRMGPIFEGMLLSGKKVAEQCMEKLRQN